MFDREKVKEELRPIAEEAVNDVAMEEINDRIQSMTNQERLVLLAALRRFQGDAEPFENETVRD